MEEQASGEWSGTLVRLLDQLARVEIAQARFERAGELYRRAPIIIETAQGKSAAALIPVLIATAKMHQMAGDPAAAEPVLLRAIAARIESSGAQTPELAGDYLLLARLYSAQKKFTQATGVFGWPAPHAIEKSTAVRWLHRAGRWESGR